MYTITESEKNIQVKVTAHLQEVCSWWIENKGDSWGEYNNVTEETKYLNFFFEKQSDAGEFVAFLEGGL